MSSIHLVLNHAVKGEGGIQGMMRSSDQINVADFLTVGISQLHYFKPDDRDRRSMTTKDGQFTLVWDGALYNSYELRNELLRKKRIFESHSDTEVLIQWLREYGTSGIKRLEGVFALFFVDNNNR